MELACYVSSCNADDVYDDQAGGVDDRTFTKMVPLFVVGFVTETRKLLLISVG